MKVDLAMLRWGAFCVYVTGPVLTNLAYLSLTDQVTATGERLLMVTSTFGVDPSLPLIGMLLCLRDWVQATLGRMVTCAAICIGTALSALVSPEVAAASGLAFLVSESVDFVCYTFLARHKSLAILLSGLLGAMVDSAVFLGVAFGSMVTWGDQTIGKVATVVIVAIAFRASQTQMVVARA